MSQTFDTFVPTLKQKKLLASAEAVAIQADKKNDQALLKDATGKATAFFEQYRYWWINDNEMIFDRETGLLWQGKPDTSAGYSVANAKTKANSLKLGGLSGWQLPTVHQIKQIVENNFPLRQGDHKRILGWGAITHSTGAMWLDRDYPSSVSEGQHCLFIHSLFAAKPSIIETLKAFTERKWTYKPSVAHEPSALKQLHQHAKNIRELSKKTYTYTPQVDIATVWKDIDYISTRLPPIDALRFTDVDQGMWEFFVPKALQGKFSKVQSKQFFRDRNPALDIQQANVAIDFGTSSTVVAIRKNGKDEMLRIGMQAKDYANDAINDQQYENPTVLEFIDLQEFLTEWHSEAYRPLVSWSNACASHEARANLRNNDSSSKIISSILLRLKQWALRDENQPQVRIRDQQDYEYQLKPLTAFNPVKGSAIELGKNYPELDPIEVYAWFLGMNINWRARGIYLNYYLTFPVEYPNDVKAKILAAFRRGLQRSLPESLMYDAAFGDFRVEALASEPAAFAAAALERLEIEPVDGGVSYAVFDFGGGTTDFDYGFYRTPTEDEHDEGWDHVIEHFGSSGDKFLGGENLLENLAYLVFQANSSECRKKSVAFTKPLDAESFAGSELLIAQTQAAYTNTTMMMSALRPLWEQGKLNADSEGAVNFKLINKDGKPTDCEITIKQEDLISWLQERIRSGLKNFFIALRVAFKQRSQQLPALIHILLAGNSSRSRIVLGLLGRLDDEPSHVLHESLLADLATIFPDDTPEFEIHLPLNADPKKPYAATAKTGVALGLLRLCPGETLKVVNYAEEDNVDSPFQFFVGTHRRDVLQVAMHRGQAYDEWVELGVPRQGVFPLLYTTAPQAAMTNSVKRGDAGLFEKNLRLSGNIQGHKIFAKVVAPNEIEVCTAQNLDEVNSLQASNLQKILLSAHG